MILNGFDGKQLQVNGTGVYSFNSIETTGGEKVNVLFDGLETGSITFGSTNEALGDVDFNNIAGTVNIGAGGIAGAINNAENGAINFVGKGENGSFAGDVNGLGTLGTNGNNIIFWNGGIYKIASTTGTGTIISNIAGAKFIGNFGANTDGNRLTSFLIY